MAPTLPVPDPIDPSFVPKTSIKTLPAATTSIEEILATLDTDSGIILTDFVNTTELEAIAEETAPYYENKGPPGHDIVLIPKETVLLGGLVGKSKTAAKLCEHPTLKELRDRILVERYDYKQEGLPVRKITIAPLLSVSLTFNVGYGAPRQRLHRDDNIWGTKHPAPIKLEEETQFAVLIAGVDVRRENGATMFVPGSHRWDDERLPSVDEICFAEMKPGSALIFLSSAYHGSGHNSVPGFTRTVHGLFFCRGNRRTEENQFLAIPQSTALGMSDEMLSLLGYQKPDTTLGLVESQDALAYVRSNLVKADA